ncbi:hypothetical protein GCM10023093_04310 [Nemorincola caseinilytica]|uniref:Outer membrane protein beta-barrel domain-containing protein n=1 Tax=Nemorincola caseinilytica TaxID=2054315 RepID=A0ABP8N3X1_9BACT
MKLTFITTAVAALFCASTAHAQLGVVKKVAPVVSLGVKVGANMQKVDGGGLDDAYKGGFVAGAFVCVSKKKMGVRVEGLVKSAKIDYSISTVPSVKTVMLDVPVLFEYAPIKRLKLHVGPQFTTMLSAKQNDVDVKDQFKSAELSAVAGVEVNLPLKFIVGARYIYGLTDVSTISGTKVTNSSIQVSVGYRFLN